ncbi:MAG: SusC/RagA family TonB-linked outer membrane protein [Odoribacter sp.]
MKLTFLMTVCLVYGLSAEVLSQQKVSMDLGRTTVKEALAEFQKQTGRMVIYSSEKLQTAHRVNATFKDADVDTFFSTILAECGMSYREINDYILIVPKQEVTIPQAKEQEIVGTVSDESGHPLPGVSVMIKGTMVGVATDVNGKFLVKIPEMKDLVLVFSFIGMEKQEIAYRGQQNMKVVLKEMAAQMDEVVVTGYQTIKKTRMTGSTETVTSKDIVNKGYTSVEEVLKGQMPGVATMSISGRPGAQAQIRIRGINSLTGDTDPIWIVDGMPLQGDVPSVSMGGTEFQESVLTSGIGNIPPDDIESITVLKDAAATGLYGSRAANGVIVVTTKRGSVGKSYINVQASYAITAAPTNRLEMMNTREKIDFERSIYEDFPGINLGGRVQQLLRKADNGVISRSAAEQEMARLSQINTNWFDEIFRRGETQNHSVTLSGGSETTQYYANLSYLSEKGVMPNNKYETIGANLKLTHDFNKRLRILFDVRTSLRNDRSTASSVNPLNYATFANPYERPYDENGNWEYDRSYSSELSTVRDGYKYDFNILKDLNENTNKSRYLSNQLNLKLEYKIIDGLMYSIMGTLSNSNTHSMAEVVPGSYTSKANSWVNGIYAEGETPDYLNNGKLSESTSRSQGWTIRNQVEFARGFSDGDHYINAFVGQEVSSQKGYSFSSMIPEWNPVYGTGSYPELNGIEINSKMNLSSFGSHRETQDRSVSFFANASYSFKDRYVVSGTARLDGADIIGTANRFSPLWNVGLKWNLHNESFMAGVDFVNQFSIRGSYGFTGSIDRNALPFSLLRKYSNNYTYDDIKLMDEYQPANPSIKWQRKEDRNIGLDFSILNNRVNFTMNYYNNDTRNLLDTKNVNLSSGRPKITANVASLRNSGWEFSLRTLNVSTDDFSWTTSFNFTTNKNVVTETFYKKIDDVPANVNSTMEDMYNLYIEGESVKSFYGFKYAGVDPATGGALAYVDGFDKEGNRMGSLYHDGRYVVNMDGDVTGAEKLNARVYLGESYPPYTGGFSTSFTYKRISLSTNFTYMGGHFIRSFQSYTSGGNVNATAQNVLAIEANRWRKPGDMTDIPKYIASRSSYLYDIYDFRYEKGDFLKCNNVSLGYNFAPKFCSKLSITRARLNFNMSNLFTLTKYRGIDPENMGAFGYPSAKRYNFSLSIGI